jgi:hypothetical protein
MDPFIWPYVIENCMDVKEGDSDDDSSNDKYESVEEDKDDDDENTTSSPTKSKNKKPKYNALGDDNDNMDVLGDDNDNMDNLRMAKLYPHLAGALGGEDGFDPMNPSVQKSMHCLLRELNHLLSTTYELNGSDTSNNKISYVRVPCTSSNHSFLNSKEWVDTAIQITGSKHGGTFELVHRVAYHLLHFYKDSVLAACKNQKVPICKEMSLTQFKAMLCAAGVSGTGERELKNI